MFSKTIELRASRRLTFLLILMHLGACFVIATLSLSLMVRTLLTIICLLSMIRVLQKHVWHNCLNSIQGLIALENGVWLLRKPDGHFFEGRIRGDSVITTFLLILNFSVTEKFLPQSVIIFRDTLAEGEFRKLRIHLVTTRVIG